MRVEYLRPDTSLTTPCPPMRRHNMATVADMVREIQAQRLAYAKCRAKMDAINEFFNGHPDK